MYYYYNLIEFSVFGRVYIIINHFLTMRQPDHFLYITYLLFYKEQKLKYFSVDYRIMNFLIDLFRYLILKFVSLLSE